MRLAFRRSLPWLLAGTVLAAAGAGLIARNELVRLREAFETDARIVHRLLSQRVVQHEAILATLALLQPGDAAAGSPEQRLPALYPQVLRVQRRDAVAWGQAAFDGAETRSRQLRRAVLVEADLGAGRCTVLQAAEPASYAMQIDLQRMVPWNDWPMAAGSPVRVWLELDGRQLVLQPGAPAAGGWSFDFAKHLAAESQPFELRAARRVGWRELPWAAMAAWVIGVVVLLSAAAAALRQRQARRRAEELLRLGQVGRLNALGELAAGMAHELNQPLTALLASTQAARRLLDDDPPELATARDAMARAVEQARRAAEVVGRLRRTVERPDRLGELRPVPLHEAVHNVLDLLEPECRRRGVELLWQMPPEPPTVQADPVALEQIVHNLVMNALQALEQVPPGQRQLELVLGRDGAQGTLAVADSGPGLPDELMARVFEPFFTTRAGGLGLGLSLCETLASAMGGALSVMRREPQGACFRLALPLAQEAAVPDGSAR